jgi:hypothetical protein|uniref:DUF47 family protein n=1 Tax=Ignisphaera aggregans TaxID=334771 RepID=A0A7J2U638_9CREN
MYTKSKLMLSLALLKDLHNKIEYYKTMVNNNIRRLELLTHSDIRGRKIDVSRELRNLMELKKGIEGIDVFLENIIMRLETLLISEQVILSAMLIKELSKELKHTIGNTIPVIDVYIDKLNIIANDVVNQLRMQESKGEIITASEEAKKIIREAKQFFT